MKIGQILHRFMAVYQVFSSEDLANVMYSAALGGGDRRRMGRDFLLLSAGSLANVECRL